MGTNSAIGMSIFERPVQAWCRGSRPRAQMLSLVGGSFKHNRGSCPAGTLNMKAQGSAKMPQEWPELGSCASGPVRRFTVLSTIPGGFSTQP